MIVPAKVKCFTWIGIRRACLTQKVLQKKWRPLVPRCTLCNLTGETNGHLFLHCKYTSQLWELFLNISGQTWSLPEDTGETNGHLFLHCKYTSQLWDRFLNIYGQSWSMPEHTSDLLSCWIRRGAAKLKKDCGNWFLHVFGGQSGEKGMIDVLKINPIPFTKSNGIV